MMLHALYGVLDEWGRGAFVTWTLEFRYSRMQRISIVHTYQLSSKQTTCSCDIVVVDVAEHGVKKREQRLSSSQEEESHPKCLR